MNPPLPRTILTIAGSDPLGGAGLQADLKTIQAHHAYGLSVTTAINAQNTQGVMAVNPLPVECVAQQLDSLLSDVQIDAIKIGQLASAEIITLLADRLAAPNCPIVLDPVLISSSGKRLLTESAQPGLLHQLMPLATLITPNIPEVNALLNASYQGLAAEMPHIASQFFALGMQAVLVKGGHSSENRAVDYLLLPNQNPLAFSTPRIADLNVKGTGCILSSAIAYRLAAGNSLPDAAAKAKHYLYNQFNHLTQLPNLKVTSTLQLIRHI